MDIDVDNLHFHRSACHGGLIGAHVSERLGTTDSVQIILNYGDSMVNTGTIDSIKCSCVLLMKVDSTASRQALRKDGLGIWDKDTHRSKIPYNSATSMREKESDSDIYVWRYVMVCRSWPMLRRAETYCHRREASNAVGELLTCMLVQYHYEGGAPANGFEITSLRIPFTDDTPKKTKKRKRSVKAEKSPAASMAPTNNEVTPKSTFLKSPPAKRVARRKQEAPKRLDPSPGDFLVDYARSEDNDEFPFLPNDLQSTQHSSLLAKGVESVSATNTQNLSSTGLSLEKTLDVVSLYKLMGEQDQQSRFIRLLTINDEGVCIGLYSDDQLELLDQANSSPYRGGRSRATVYIEPLATFDGFTLHFSSFLVRNDDPATRIIGPIYIASSMERQEFNLAGFWHQVFDRLTQPDDRSPRFLLTNSRPVRETTDIDEMARSSIYVYESSVGGISAQIIQDLCGILTGSLDEIITQLREAVTKQLESLKSRPVLAVPAESRPEIAADTSDAATVNREKTWSVSIKQECFDEESIDAHAHSERTNSPAISNGNLVIEESFKMEPSAKSEWSKENASKLTFEPSECHGGLVGAHITEKCGLDECVSLIIRSKPEMICERPGPVVGNCSVLYIFQVKTEKNRLALRRDKMGVWEKFTHRSKLRFRSDTCTRTDNGDLFVWEYNTACRAQPELRRTEVFCRKATPTGLPGDLVGKVVIQYYYPIPNKRQSLTAPTAT